MTIESEVQKLNPDALVTLYQIDLNPIGVNYVFYFTKNSRPGGAPVPFDGDDYVGIDCKVSGFSFDGAGSFPTPKLMIANMAGTLTALIRDYNALVGATFRRIRTFEKYLDDGATPDPGQIMGDQPDVFTIDQCTGRNKIYLEWRLSSTIEETDRMLPGRTCFRDFCPFIYRTWNGSSFVDIDTAGSKVTCIYQGSNYFDENDVATTAANDKCGKTLNSCMKRFGSRSQLGFGGFPGVGQDKSY